MMNPILVRPTQDCPVTMLTLWANSWYAQANSCWHQKYEDIVPALYYGDSAAMLCTAICENHRFNYNLWHVEDRARDPSASVADIGQVKRAIDPLNQARNDAIGQIDKVMLHRVALAGNYVPSAPKPTETPGMAFDRLSILSLRIYHLNAELQPGDVEDEHRRVAWRRLRVCLDQQSQLVNSLMDYLSGMENGLIAMPLWDALKLYNDPEWNPVTRAATEDKA